VISFLRACGSAVLLTFLAASFAVVLVVVTLTFFLEEAPWADKAFDFALLFCTFIISLVAEFLTAVFGFESFAEALAVEVLVFAFAVLLGIFFTEAILDFAALTLGLLAGLLEEVFDLALGLGILAFLVAGIAYGCRYWSW